MRNLMWIGSGLAVLLLFVSPVLGMILGVAVLISAVWSMILRRGWRFIAPKRARLMRGIALSVEYGPVASGLVPSLAFAALCILVLAAAAGVRL